jgi:hypothetical protein
MRCRPLPPSESPFALVLDSYHTSCMACSLHNIETNHAMHHQIRSPPGSMRMSRTLLRAHQRRAARTRSGRTTFSLRAELPPCSVPAAWAALRGICRTGTPAHSRESGAIGSFLHSACRCPCQVVATECHKRSLHNTIKRDHSRGMCLLVPVLVSLLACASVALQLHSYAAD